MELASPVELDPRTADWGSGFLMQHIKLHALVNSPVQIMIATHTVSIIFFPNSTKIYYLCFIILGAVVFQGSCCGWGSRRELHCRCSGQGRHRCCAPRGLQVSQVHFISSFGELDLNSF